MSARQSVYVSHIVKAESLPSPHATVAAITAEVRLFYPPNQEPQALAELHTAYNEAREQLKAKWKERLEQEAVFARRWDTEPKDES